MTKKDFSGALRKTATAQKTVIDDRFAKADSVLLAMKPDGATAVVEAPVEVPPKEAPVSTPSEAHPQESPKVDAVVRDTFSMPAGDHALIEQLRVRAAKQGRNTNKSEVIRAGLKALSGVPADQLVALLEGLERVKPGRK